MHHDSKGPSTDHYKNAGVDTAAGDALVEWLQAGKPQFKHPKGLGHVADGIGGFAGLFALNLSKFKNPMLVASTDGVGTKLLLGIENNDCEHLGQDLVAMCVNDLYTVGAIPLFFLDYYATGALNNDQFKQVLSSIRKSCQACDMALLGGETAEMPGLYSKGHFDLAGFVVGAVDGEHRLGPHRVKIDDSLIAFASSGFHANGFSLIRKWLGARSNGTLIKQLLTPTKLYVEIPQLMDRHKDSFHALANITGGGISGNLPRVIPDGLAAEIKFDSLQIPEWMRHFIEENVDNIREVEPVFNMGAGMIAIVDCLATEKFISDATTLGLKPHTIGKIVPSNGPSCVQYV